MALHTLGPTSWPEDWGVKVRSRGHRTSEQKRLALPMLGVWSAGRRHHSIYSEMRDAACRRSDPRRIGDFEQTISETLTCSAGFGLRFRALPRWCQRRVALRRRSICQVAASRSMGVPRRLLLVGLDFPKTGDFSQIGYQSLRLSGRRETSSCALTCAAPMVLRAT